MSAKFSIIMPAFRAEKTVVAAVGSVLKQTHGDWELIIISDDEKSYEQVLVNAGISDDRIRHLSTGETGSGSSSARNVGLDIAQHDLIAILDADDLMHPGKLEMVAPFLAENSLVSTALDIRNSDGELLRQVGIGNNRTLSAGTYKFTNISMDSMIVYDRRVGDPRYDDTLPCLTDLDFLLKLFATRERCIHIGIPLHTYVKQYNSVSNGPGTSQTIARTKQKLLIWLANDHYPMQAPGDRDGISRFLKISLKAETSYETALKMRPGLLFEDHLEPLLVTNSPV